MKIYLQKTLKPFVVILILFYPLISFGQQLPKGIWAGDLNFGGATAHQSILSFSASDGGSTKVLVSIPSSGMHDLKADCFKLVGDSLWVSFKDHMASYTFVALYNRNKEQISGTLEVPSIGLKVPLTLKPANADSIRPNRPQTPIAPFSYAVLPAKFEGGGEAIVLRGTITAPKVKKELPGVVLVSGSGPHNRDGEQFYHKTFLVLADELTKRGFAVLRYDERGVGESSGTYGGNFTEDFARDAAAAVKALRADKRVKVKDVYVIGHSEGTLMTQIVAAEDPAVTGIVLMAAVGLSGVELSKARHRVLLKARGLSEEKIDSAQDVRFQEKAYDIIAAAPDSATARSNFNKWFKEETGSDADYSDMYIAPYLNPWHFHHLHFEPKFYQNKIKVPVLAISGAKDSQAPAEQNIFAIKQGLLEGGNEKFTEVILPEMNHFMQTSVTGSYNEPFTLKETFAHEALKIIGDWLEIQVKANNKPKKGQKSK
ncbi:alpha/beta hydrolase family protein [Pontibacter pudoricolor]|uniref:alpha/beta hydrolase family protein n=1 Tax=Pontibacter pudoricolor TaxID=2694930 RepID=UPI0013908D9D|nr:alpha/beta fold hydrolase [Pontibacter pudoricolor]